MSLMYYLMQVNLYLIVFYALYKLALEKETYFVLNRFYLTGTVLISFAIPALPLHWMRVETIAGNLSINMADIVPAQSRIQISSFNFLQLGTFIYVTGILFSVFRLIRKLVVIRRSMVSPDDGAAFSFFGYKKIDRSLRDYSTINIHEEAHIKQVHSADVLFLEIASIFTWFNPVIYFYKNSIRDIHEFLADQAATDYLGDKKEYAFLLLSKALNINQYPLANSFFKQSLVKKRVFMLQKERSGNVAVLKYILLIPILVGLIVLSSATNFKAEEPVTDLSSIDQKPEFPGGFQKFSEYLVHSVKYPAQAIDAGVEGRVVLNFVVNTDGSLTDIKVLRSIESSLDEEALRVIQNSPKWIPGSLKGKPVRVQYHMPLKFKLPAKK